MCVQILSQGLYRTRLKIHPRLAHIMRSPLCGRADIHSEQRHSQLLRQSPRLGQSRIVRQTQISAKPVQHHKNTCYKLLEKPRAKREKTATIIAEWRRDGLGVYFVKAPIRGHCKRCFISAAIHAAFIEWTLLDCHPSIKLIMHGSQKANYSNL
jgi:hypothetical protein